MPEDLAERVAKTIEDLPSLPSVVQQALAMMADPTTEPEELERVLARDPGLTLRVLRLANSAYYRRSREVKTLSGAIVLLGFKTVHTLVLGSAVHRLISRAGKVAEPLWLHCYGVGLACREWARRMRETVRFDPEEAFLAGLFHDVGKGVIAVRFPGLYDSPVGGSGEREALGFDHAELGGLLLQRWEIPGSIGEAVTGHHGDAPEGLAALVRAADWAVQELAPSVGNTPERPEDLEALSADEALLGAIQEAVRSGLAEEGSAS